MNCAVQTDRLAHYRKGFTFVEIMVVMVILGVLAAVGAPKIMGIIEKSREELDVLKLYNLRDALNRALIESESALSSYTPAKNQNDDKKTDLLTKLTNGLASDKGATLFVIEVHNGLSINVQGSHGSANNSFNISEMIGVAGTWCDALKEAGFEGVADIIAARIKGGNNYKKDGNTFTSTPYTRKDNNGSDVTDYRTAPKRPMFSSRVLNVGTEASNTRYTMSLHWTDKNHPHSIEVFLLPNGKKWNQAFQTDNGVCFSTLGNAGCNGK